MPDLKDRKVEFFRAHIEPGITTMPKNAIHAKDVQEMELMPHFIYILTHAGAEHIVPFSNCQTIKLLPKDKVTK